jgi:hypothetical protein
LWDSFTFSMVAGGGPICRNKLNFICTIHSTVHPVLLKICDSSVGPTRPLSGTRSKNEWITCFIVSLAGLCNRNWGHMYWGGTTVQNLRWTQWHSWRFKCSEMLCCGSVDKQFVTFWWHYSTSNTW